MDIFSVLSLFGGLALFLFGMQYMGSGLEKASGGKLEKLLEKMTDNPIKGVLLGVAVTAVIQSSSATTVMVVGFVNSGIMKLGQAVGVIMGANIGTTVTAWILSLSGIQGDSVVMRMLKPESFSPVIALIGVVMIMMCKNGKKREIGSILVGFAILMYGMSAMSSAVKPLADMPEFGRILLIFNNPVLGIIAGAVLTGIIQSSSASVGILQALSSTGMLPYSTAVPIIMGQNIGTCVTAMISAIGACKNGKRAACVHLYFNLIGTLLFLTGYYAIDAIVGFPFADEMITEQGIAVIHTAFNVITTLVLLPFSKKLEKLACLTIRDNPKDAEEAGAEHAVEKTAVMLDDRFLATPAFALEQCTGVANQMSEVSFKAIKRAMKLVGNYNEKEAEKVRNEEEQADVFEDRLGTYLVKLSSRELSLADSKTATRLLHDIGDYERISDHAVNIVDAAKEMHEKHISFSDEAMHELDVISAAINEILDRTQKAVITGDLEAASHIEPLEQVIDGLRDEIKSRHIDRLRDGRCTIELGFILCDILTNYERVSDHCSNLAACLIKSAEQSFETHKFLSEMKDPSNTEYKSEYENFGKKYAI